MSVYSRRPWLTLYDRDVPADIESRAASALELFQASLDRAPARPLIHYFDRTLTLDEVAILSDGLAAAFDELGIERGERIAVYLQNVPQFAVAMLAIWKVGGIVVPVNPMLKERELAFVLRDSQAAALVSLESLYDDVAASVLPGSGVRVAVTTSELDLLGDTVPPLLADIRRRRPLDTHDLLDLSRRFAGDRFDPVRLDPDDVAFLTYTSGTTGPPKGAMNTHRNVVFNAQAYRDWAGLTPADVVLGVAPLFHITGLIAHLAVSMLVPMPLVLGYRFDAETTLDLAERHRATFTIGSITAFIALMSCPSARGRDLSSLTKVLSGGAPIAPATLEAWETAFGSYIHNVYGLTETTSPSHMVPMGRRAPVDVASRALSVGVPIPSTAVRVVDDEGSELPAGEVGEIAISGPQVVAGYWQKPEESAAAFRDGALLTGDAGFMDDDGWFYLVDRRKDQINASGYKIWPREVEDVLYEHPAVREAAVVGVPDRYRGETVKAFVSLQPGRRVEETELISFCRARLAAYKYPRQIELMPELPKTATGKILRRALRSAPP